MYGKDSDFSVCCGKLSLHSTDFQPEPPRQKLWSRGGTLNRLTRYCDIFDHSHSYERCHR